MGISVVKLPDNIDKAINMATMVTNTEKSVKSNVSCACAN
jgi:hypothetical protein